MREVMEIWPYETGILDLPVNWNELEVKELSSVSDAWKAERERLETSNQLRRFTEEMSDRSLSPISRDCIQSCCAVKLTPME